MNNDLATLAQIASEVMSSCDDFTDNGAETSPGFFVIYNTRAGQSRTVVHHKESGYVFKFAEGGTQVVSGDILGEVVLDGITHRIRLPEFYRFNTVSPEFGNIEVEVAEFVTGEVCCGEEATDDGWCDHAVALRRAIDGVLYDTHNGNWVINESGDVVIFDFAF